jgi:hypothetical protein
LIGDLHEERQKEETQTTVDQTTSSPVDAFFGPLPQTFGPQRPTPSPIQRHTFPPLKLSSGPAILLSTESPPSETPVRGQDAHPPLISPVLQPPSPDSISPPGPPPLLASDSCSSPTPRQSSPPPISLPIPLPTSTHPFPLASPPSSHSFLPRPLPAPRRLWQSFPPPSGIQKSLQPPCREPSLAMHIMTEEEFSDCSGNTPDPPSPLTPSLSLSDHESGQAMFDELKMNSWDNNVSSDSLRISTQTPSPAALFLGKPLKPELTRSEELPGLLDDMSPLRSLAPLPTTPVLVPPLSPDNPELSPSNLKMQSEEIWSDWSHV